MTELEFGARLKQLRQNKHMTQQELADQLGVSNKSVSRWESGGYPDIAILPLLAKALEVSTDELLGCQPPLRSFGRSDWQNLMSYAFALGGGVVFYLFDVFMPVAICYLLYLAMMAYGIYLQRHYTYHSHWFYGANALMDFFINLQLTSFLVGGQMLLSGLQSFTFIMTSMDPGEKTSYFCEYILNLLLHVIPWIFTALVLTGITQLVICRTAGSSPQLPRLILYRTRLDPTTLLTVLSPVLLACFWLLYDTENPRHMWLYVNQAPLFLGLWLVLTVLIVLYLLLTKRHRMLIPACLMQLGTLLYPTLAGVSRAYSTVSGRFIEYSRYLQENTYFAFGQSNGRIWAAAIVLILLYLLCCTIKIESSPK